MLEKITNLLVRNEFYIRQIQKKIKTLKKPFYTSSFSGYKFDKKNN